jgi:choline-sulfatase
VRERPHLLLLVADQLSALFLRAYGHRVTRTPVLDRLAEEGVLFENAYSPSPLCAPARAVLMTGLLPSRTGVYDNGAEFRSSIPTFAHALRLEGYRTCLSGKGHFVGPDQLHGFEERLTTDIYPSDYGWTPDWARGDERIDWWFHDMSSVKEAGVAEITNQLEYDDEVAFHAARWLYDHARYEPDVPLCLCVSFTHPHDPYVARRRHWDLYRDDEIDLPAAPALPDPRVDPHAERLRKAIGMEGVEVTEDDVRASRHGYYASLSYVDEKVGGVLEALDTCGMADDTVVVFVSDHGDFLGEHGLFYKMSFREHAARVPLIVRAPGRFAPRRVREPVGLADLAPTLAELARPGLAAALGDELDGRSLVPLLEGADEGPEGAALGEYLAEGTTAPMVMIRRGRWKLVHAEGDPDQLFDLDRDPLELENLAGSAEHAGLLAAFRDEVQRRWDLGTLGDAVRRSQRDRLAVFPALQQGRRAPWDYQPVRDASSQYTRNTMDVAGRDRLSRYPPAEPRG